MMIALQPALRMFLNTFQMSWSTFFLCAKCLLVDCAIRCLFVHTVSYIQPPSTSTATTALLAIPQLWRHPWHPSIVLFCACSQRPNSSTATTALLAIPQLWRHPWHPSIVLFCACSQRPNSSTATTALLAIPRPWRHPRLLSVALSISHKVLSHSNHQVAPLAQALQMQRWWQKAFQT